MPLLLVIEDGTGVTDANTYCSRDAADAYHESVLNAEAWVQAVEADKDRALVMATRLLDEHLRWVGAPVLARETPAWPRTGMVDRDGRLIASGTLPTCLIEATAEFARRLIESNRVREAEDAAVGISSGGRSRSYAAGRTVPVVPPAVLLKLGHLTVTSRIARVA